jgi:hypothetical protein
MKKLLIIIFFGVISGCLSPPSTTKNHAASAKQIEDRYKSLWHEVDPSNNDYKKLLIHIGPSKGTKTALWALMERNQELFDNRKWSIQCDNNIKVSITETIVDSTYGSIQLIVERNNNQSSVKCKISSGVQQPPVEVTLPKIFQESDQEYSFLAYSCSEPFTSKERKDGRGILNRDISLWLRMQSRAEGELAGTYTKNIPFKPDFVLGLGDQIYVDPDPKEDPEHRLAFFGGDRSSDWFIKQDQQTFESALQTVYRYNFALPPQNATFSKLASKMMWDDHEIRDGWGSQGDEDDVNSSWPIYFKSARHAFIAHQYLRSLAPEELNQSNYDKLVLNEAPLHTSFNRGPTSHFLMLDSRSNRGKGALLDSDSIAEVSKWLAQGNSDEGNIFVLTVGTPLFPAKIGESFLKKVEPEIKDDIKDSWGSKENKESQKNLIVLLEKHFKEKTNDRLIILSGDVHFSSIFELSLDGDDRVYGHEIITSGIAHSLPKIAMFGNYLLNRAAKIQGTETIVRPLGKINHSATFAEIIVRKQSTGLPPNVDLIFHTNGTKTTSYPWAWGWLAEALMSITNQESWVLTNTHLQLNRNKKPLGYHEYNFNYKVNEHTINTNIPKGKMGAGLMINLKVGSQQMVKEKGNKIESDIQGQSGFCLTTHSYEDSLAKNWETPECKNITLNRQN